jgi:N,N-dimethylformamidase beta subunit-like protein/VCBS repeat protein
MVHFVSAVVRLSAVAVFSFLGCSNASRPRAAVAPENVVACARAADGVWCTHWSGASFAPVTRWSTDFGYTPNRVSQQDMLRTPDLDDDGQSDLCLRDAHGLSCAIRMSRDSFGASVPSDVFSDEQGFATWSSATTLAFADVDGDGYSDACARQAAQLLCAHGRGNGGFDAPTIWMVGDLGEGDDPLRQTTTRFGDIDGDGRADLCVSSADGVRCARSEGTRFGAPSLWTEAFARQADGLSSPTFELVDVDADARLDICGRQDNDVRCWLSRGSRFQPGPASLAVADDDVVRFGDVDGDHRADICAFGDSGARCATARAGFAALVPWDSAAPSDGVGQALELLDVDGDGRADRCEVGSWGVACARSDGAHFAGARSPPAFAPGSTPTNDLDPTALALGMRTQPLATASNPVVVENQRPGTNGWWIPYPQWAANREIEAYTDRTSYLPGDAVDVMLSTATDGDAVHWTLFRTGWYSGRGARAMVDGDVTGHAQPAPTASAPLKAVRAGWARSFSFRVPNEAVSGVYALRLDSKATGKGFFVTFVVRQHDRAAAILFDRADFTDEAYNDWDGGANQSSAYKGAFYVSFDRPLRSVGALGIYSYSSGYFTYEYSMVRWLERQGYDVAYVSDVDVHQGVDLSQARVFLSVGHNEYWSGAMRDHVEHARDAGLNLAFFGSDAVDGEIRFATGDPRSFSRTISDSNARKNEFANKPLDLKLPPHANPSDSLTGTHYTSWCSTAHPECTGDPTAKLRFADDFVIAMPEHPIFRGIDASVPLRQVVGYEYEAAYGASDQLPFQLQLVGQTDGLHLPEQAVMVAYRATSGALVANLGSMHWNHALDEWAGRAAIRATGGERPCSTGEADCFSRHDLAAEQVTMNILSDMGVVAATPLASLQQTRNRYWP